MNAKKSTRYPLVDYDDPDKSNLVFRLGASPLFTPLDLNVEFLKQSGWNASVDRFRFFSDLSSVQAEVFSEGGSAQMEPILMI